MTTKPNLKPAAAFENAHLVAQDLLERIKELLFSGPSPEDPALNWCHVAELNEANRRLSQVIGILDGSAQ